MGCGVNFGEKSGKMGFFGNILRRMGARGAHPVREMRGMGRGEKGENFAKIGGIMEDLPILNG